MKKTSLTLLGLGLMLCLYGQSYTSFFTGSTADAQITPLGGTCIMGGATEDDNAMRWFLQGAEGGDILVIRTSGSDGYNDYMYSTLGVSVNSVETILFNSPEAASDPYVRERINKAEAIWIAGGDQWNYVSYWRNTPMSNAINTAISQRSIMIGGTSAGMAILGGAYFSAQNGTVTTNEALSNPYSSNMTVDNTPFLDVPFLDNVITDSHYDDPDRRGRHVAFLAKAMTDFGQTYFGIACDEYTAVCITSEGIASVYGTYPDYDDNAYFLMPNCGLADNSPEQCTPNESLIWDHNGEAVKVYAVKGTPTGLYNFDLSNWQDGNGGEWQNWSVDANQLTIENDVLAPDCIIISTESKTIDYDVKLFPNPAYNNRFNIELPNDGEFTVRLYDELGRFLHQWNGLYGRTELFWIFPAKGVYIVEVLSQSNARGVYQLVVE